MKKNIMKILQGLFAKKEPVEMDDLTDIAKEVGLLLDNTASEVFIEHRHALLKEDIVYIVYAVWGAKKNGELNAEQLAIHRKIMPVISKAKAMICLQGITQKQAYALESLIRSVLINRITFMIAHFHNSLNQKISERASGDIRDDSTDHDIDSWLSNLHVSETNPWWKRMRFDGGAFDQE